MAFTLHQVQNTVAVAELGSASHPAQALSISHSSVAEPVRFLEDNLSVKLFGRHPRGLSITRKGHQFLRHAMSIMREVSSARRALELDDEEISGILQLGVTSLMAGYVMSDLLAR